jgi:hypothetical protein
VRLEGLGKLKKKTFKNHTENRSRELHVGRNGSSFFTATFGTLWQLFLEL